MTKPEPIEGWSFEVDGLPGALQWRARRWEPESWYGPAGGPPHGKHETYPTTEVAYFDSGGFHVEDQTEYDGRSCFRVPIAVLDKLRELQSGEQLKLPTSSETT